jgi:coenzyme F420 biosynthesis associated uncharacterized protein
MDPIDWRVAQRVGEMIADVGAPGPPPTSAAAVAVQPLAERFAESVASYSGLRVESPLPTIELVDRPRWIEANIATMRPLMAPLGARLGQGSGPLAPALRSVSGLLLGAQIGAVTGMLSQRVLGQYDIALLDESVAPRLLLVAPNLTQAARNMGADREQLTSWVAIHEVTHAVQFGGASWLRGHLASLLRRLIDSLEVRPGGGRPMRLPDLDRLRALARRLTSDPGSFKAPTSNDLLRLTLGADRWQLVEQMQATMSLVEGHAEHVMDAVGAEALPSLDQMRTAMTRRRRARAWPWRIVERLLGMEMKLRQYEVGRRFCDEIVREGGPGRLAEVWGSPQALPSSEELERPQLWLARMQATA